MNDARRQVVDAVGPVLAAGAETDVVLAALRRRNDPLVVENRGAYVRVLASGRCVLRRSDVEALLGRPFELPGDLERLMPSFCGRLRMDADGAEWVSGRKPAA